MEFEMHCMYRMRKILSDLWSSIESALKNNHNDTSVGTPSCNHKVSASANGLIEHLHMFNELVDTRMKMNKSMKMLHRDNYLRESIANLKDARDEVKALTFELEEERSRHKHIVLAISNDIYEENSRFEIIKASHATEIAERMKESETEITKIKEETSSETKRLELKIDASKAKLTDTSRANLDHERELYAKRSKVERQHLAVLAKYNTEVGELHRIMENLTEELSCLDERLKDLRDQLAVQDVQYVEFKNEREIAILKAFTVNLEKFERNRAAKIIQKAWRCFYERCCIRKKKKSKKKK